MLAGQELLGGGLQPLLGLVADRANRRLMVVAGALAIAMAYMTLALSTDYLAIVGAFVVLGGVGSAVMGVSLLAIQVDVGRRLGMATTMSFGSTGFAAGVLIGSLGGGVIADQAGTSTTLNSPVTD